MQNSISSGRCIRSFRDALMADSSRAGDRKRYSATPI
jgi:hypothetical protein